MSVPRWRQGGKVPMHVYEQRGDEPDRRPYPDGDPPVATFFTAEAAALACRAVAVLRLLETEPAANDERDAVTDP